jgi:hypothetical protein
VRGDKLRCGSTATLPPALHDMLREHKPGIIKELLRRASSGSEPRAVKSGPHVIEGNASGVAAAPDRPAPGASPLPQDPPRGGPAARARSDLPLGVSHALASGINAAAHFHVQFWLDEQGLLITQPPQDYRREVQAAERALMERREEIKTICHWSRRPRGYTDANWVRAVVDSCRLGYNLWREGDR